MITKDFLIDIDFEKAKYVRNMRFVQGDTKSNAIALKLAKNGVAVDLTGLIVGITFLRADNVKIVAEAHNTDATAGEAKYVIANNIIDVPGQVLVSVAVYGPESERLTHSVQFSFEVIEDLGVDATEITEDDRYPILTQLMSDNVAIQAAEASRVTAETTRMEQEEQRQINTTNAITAASEATTRANDAADNAIVVTAEAISATNDANSATGQLNIALTKVDNAEKTMIVIPKTGVANYAAMLSTYPNPEIGWLVHTLDTMKWYRWDGSTWINIATYSNEALDALIAQVNTPLYSVPQEVTASLISIPGTARYGQFNAFSLLGNTATNVVTNGNFANGTTGWSATSATGFTVVGGVALFTPTASNGRISRSLNLPQGKYFARARVKSVESTTRLTGLGTEVFANHSGSGNFENLYGIVTTTGTLDNITIRMSKISDWTQIEVDDVMVISLTGTPLENLTADQCNARFPSWFDGTKSTLPVRVKSVGKNLLPATSDKWEQGNINGATGQGIASTTRLRTKEFIPITGASVFSTNGTGFSLNTYNWYDSNYNFISQNPTTPVNARYFKGTIKKIDDSTIIASDVVNAKPQFQLGTTATTYEPHVFTEATMPTIDASRSLPNGVKDEFNAVTGEKIQRVSNTLVVDSTNTFAKQTTASNSYTNVDVWGITLPNGITNATQYANIENFTFKSNSLAFSDSDTTKEFALSTTISQLFFKVPKGYTEAQVKTYVSLLANSMSCNYHLAREVRTRIDGIESLIAHPNGTIFVEPGIYREERFYTATGITVKDTTKPIDYIEEIWKVVGKTYLPIDTSKAVYTKGSTTFTITGAVLGEEYRYVYKTTAESTLPTIRYSYPLNVAGSLNSIIELQARLSRELGDVWMTLLPLADKELKMYMITSISTPVSATAEQIATKVNEIINAWK